ncbi:hypothetical protein M5K25_010692 [Dendrobium thyrsiflorum]|uniref:Uncharacterized protein n=1 Tax=Dendrobium thyrsiflorum TaxID=117978 RepID=A0ABD0V1A0_DENTH
MVASSSRFFDENAEDEGCSRCLHCSVDEGYPVGFNSRVVKPLLRRERRRQKMRAARGNLDLPKKRVKEKKDCYLRRSAQNGVPLEMNHAIFEFHCILE